MKLMIEIPLDLYERCKSGDYDLFDDTARAEIIKNGIPYDDKETEDAFWRRLLGTEGAKTKGGAE